MNPTERRAAIYAAICWRRFDSFGNLAMEFHASERTIQRDVILLTLSHPLETVRGCHGGVKLADWFHPGDSWLNPEQIGLLRRIEPYLSGRDRIILNSIFLQFLPH